MKGIIYKLFNDEFIYYGSTTQKYFSSRINQHKYSKNKCTSKIFNGIFNYEIVETIEIKKINELVERESYYIKNNICINKNIPCRTQKQYRLDNKDKIIDLQKKWREKNKNKFNQSQKKYYEKKGLERNERTKIICDCGGTYPQRNKKIHFQTKKHINFISNLII